jgi:hypothetical protein
MSEPRLEQVFQISGVPTYTFVEPQEYAKLLVSLRTSGRGLVIEGPSGIGKTSAVETALQRIGYKNHVTKLSARKSVDLEYIENLPELGKVGLVIVDDFHRLADLTKAKLADYLKTLADEGSTDTKVVAIGINRAGERLIDFAADLVNRIDIIRFETNPDHKVKELVTKGEKALAVQLNVANEIVEAAQGSFYIAQLLSHEVCLKSEVLERLDSPRETEVSFEAIRAAVFDRLWNRFSEPCKTFCRGTKMKPEGRAPYLNILHLLGEGSEWSLSLRDVMRQHPKLRGSISQVVDKNFLLQLFDARPTLRDILHYDPGSKIITVEDPQLVFFLKNIPWVSFAKAIGFLSVEFERRYDFALSFAGHDRVVAEALAEALSDAQVEVFYDKNEQHRIIAEDVEEYLRPIYQSEAQFVVCLLSKDYPNRIWTKFESDAFRERFKTGSVVPIWFSDAPPGLFDGSRRVGGLTFDPTKDLPGQIQQIATVLLKKLADARENRSSRDATA